MEKEKNPKLEILKRKKLISTLLTYGAILISIPILNILLPGDMCNPGLGIVIILFVFPFFIIGQLIRTFFLVGKGKEEYKLSFFTHLSIFLLGVLSLVIAKLIYG